MSLGLAQNLVAPSGLSPKCALATSMHACMKVAQALFGLPAVATLDWCDRAAAALRDIPGTNVVGVFLGTIHESGAMTDLEAAGFWVAGDPTGERARDLRCRAEFMQGIGWTAGACGMEFDPPVCAPLATLPGGGAWRSGPIGHLLQDDESGEVVLANAAAGPTVRGRCITIVWRGGRDAGEVAQAVSLLSAASRVLASRALQAIGPMRSKRSHWLSPREQVVLELLTLGRSVREIAEELHRSPHTVHDHVKALHRKLNASSRGELVARALGHAGSGDYARRMAEAERSDHGAELGAGVQIKPEPPAPVVLPGALPVARSEHRRVEM